MITKIRIVLTENIKKYSFLLCVDPKLVACCSFVVLVGIRAVDSVGNSYYYYPGKLAYIILLVPG